VCTSRTLPTIWVHMCNVAAVSDHAVKGSSGQSALVERLGRVIPGLSRTGPGRTIATARAAGFAPRGYQAVVVTPAAAARTIPAREKRIGGRHFAWSMGTEKKCVR